MRHISGLLTAYGAMRAMLTVAALIFGLAALIVGLLHPHPPLESAWLADGPCTVGLKGHDMNATATGSGARTACQAWLVGGVAAGEGGKYQCSYGRDGLTIRVRDEGEARYARVFCDSLQSWSENGGPIPDIAKDSDWLAPPSASPS